MQKVPAVEPGHDATCVRCNSRLFRNPRGGIDKPLALVIASLMIFIVANLHPIMTLDILGVKLNTTITGAAYVFMMSGSPGVGCDRLAAECFVSRNYPYRFVLHLIFHSFSDELAFHETHTGLDKPFAALGNDGCVFTRHTGFPG